MKYKPSLKIGVNRQISYTKLAMRNIVEQKSKTVVHFLITVLFLITFLIGISYINK